MIGKAFLPKSLFGRALLILVLPTVLIQLVTAYVFFERHLDNVTRYMSEALAGEAAFLVEQLEHANKKEIPGIIARFQKTTNIKVSFEPLETFDLARSGKDFPEFQALLDAKIEEPFTVRKIRDDGLIEIRVRLDRQTLTLNPGIKRLESRTTGIFLAWMLGASIAFLFIAILFLRNQLRPITRLAEAADNFGRGVDTPDFRPHGALEVRKAARAFITMRERIRKQLRTRTDMLSGISHDLRTPLTRMKLQLAMLPESEANTGLGDDVQQMEHMIQEYLDFARDEGREEAVRTDLAAMMRDVVADYQRLRRDVQFTADDAPEMELRPSGFRRMLHNLVDNALRYGKSCDIALKRAGSYAEITVDDEGPGIPQEKREEMFKPFRRLESSRNSKTGGVGLGLTIARDVVLAHGGSIALGDAPAGGLRVIIRLPL